ncbi:hypothetical protein G8A07_04460 [Roseateles sp. DAIF2]|uniref:RNase A-like domain-containing protein n=1 Tax=Roseateles sp. DAIF2 TaxID=2714952 RepID=UPI0018A32E70|nr:RNase A-like domain-containing protein [Roseateles sp. DAIF2]QPF72254.1 hypothetical protein G8A07_04460 [Roseateles sp. DAIF2]
MQIVLTPIQMAAVLSGETVDEEATLSNRLWGVGKLAAGALELIGAGALLLAPEPTALTKVGGAALGAHGLDTSSSAVRQIISGKDTTTLTAEAAQSLSTALGVDPKTAEMIGLGADIAIPLIAGGVGALRVIAVRRGAISLAAEEAAGGHTILKHVGQTEVQLRTRLATQTRIPAASTFRTLAEAERHVSAAMKAHRTAIEAWAKTSTVGGRPLTVTYQASTSVGQGVVRATGQLQQMSKLVVVLRRVQQQNRVYFVLTSYPIP